MRAVVIHDYEKGANLEEVEIVDPRSNEVVVKVAASGVCGSDMHLLHGRSVAANLPMVLGHEGAGVIEWAGSAVTDVAVGDHVVIALYGPCGQCNNCRSADFELNGNGASRHLGTRGEALRPCVRTYADTSDCGNTPLARIGVRTRGGRIPKESPRLDCSPGAASRRHRAALNTAKSRPFHCRREAVAVSPQRDHGIEFGGCARIIAMIEPTKSPCCQRGREGLRRASTKPARSGIARLPEASTSLSRCRQRDCCTTSSSPSPAATFVMVGFASDLPRSRSDVSVIVHRRQVAGHHGR